MVKNSLHDQIQALDSNWKRALADYQNLLRRVEHDKQQFSKIANVNLIARLLPSLDIMEMAAAHTKDLGVEMAAKQFHAALEEEGLQLIVPTVGETFDHNLHECTETLPVPDGQNDNTIAEVILKGYKISDYILRPARVKVYKKTL
jgi:molecular chaperone GrpE